MAKPAPVACAAPQAPKANPRPDLPDRGKFMAAMSVETENRPAPKPIKNVPIKNKTTDKIGEAKIMTIGIYNNEEEIENFMVILKKAISFLKR